MEPVLFEINNNIGFVTLNRPEKLNAFNRQMALLLQDKLDACSAQEVRCVYITGAGKGFSAGQDLAEVVDPNGPAGRMGSARGRTKLRHHGRSDRLQGQRTTRPRRHAL